MAIFIIFWSVVFALLFFVLGMLFKGILAFVDGLEESGIITLAITSLTLVVILGLYLIYEIVGDILRGGFLETILAIIILIILICIVGALLGWIVGILAVLAELLLTIGLYIVMALIWLSEIGASACDHAMEKFLTIIDNNLKRC